MEEPINTLVPLAVQYEYLQSLLCSDLVLFNENLPEGWSPQSGRMDKAIAIVLHQLQHWEEEIQFSNGHQRVPVIDVLQDLDYAASLYTDKLRIAFYRLANGFLQLRAMHDNLGDDAHFNARGEFKGFSDGIEMLSNLIRPVRAEYKRLSHDQDYGGLATRESVVLCLDAGGVRTLSSLLILRELMVKVTNIIEKGSSGNDPLIFHEIARPQDYFDYIFGSGRVGSIAVMLGHTVITVEESIRYFAKVTDFADLEQESNEDDILQGKASKILENSALGCLANFLCNPPSPLSDNCRTGVIAVPVHERPKPHIFRSYAQAPPVTGSRHPSTPGASDATGIQDKAIENPVAPFIPGSRFTVEGRFEDGSLDYPNPSVEAFFEVNRMYKAYHQDTYANIQSKGEPRGTRSGVAFFLSIGAGNSAMIPSGLEDHKTEYRKTMSSLTEDSHAHMLQITDEKGPYQDTLYCRLDVRSKDIQRIASEDEKVDGNGKETLRMIEAVTKEYLAQADVDEELHKLAGHLVRLRRKRP